MRLGHKRHLLRNLEAELIELFEEADQLHDPQLLEHAAIAQGALEIASVAVLHWADRWDELHEDDGDRSLDDDLLEEAAQL